MKIWIIGKKGLLGKTLTNLCMQKKLAHIATGHEEADITNRDQLARVAERERPTHIVNCAAYTDVDGAEAHAAIAYSVNAEGAENSARVARTHGARLMHISTDYVFDGRGCEPYLETDGCNPTNLYGKSKLEGELRVMEQCPTACILRTSWVFGPGGKNFISSLLSHFKTRTEISAVADQIGRVTYCGDLAEAVLALLCHSGIFHFANKGAVSRFEIAEALLRLAREKQMPMTCTSIQPVFSDAFPTVANRPSYSVLSTKKVENLLGCEPPSWKQALEKCLV